MILLFFLVWRTREDQSGHYIVSGNGKTLNISDIKIISRSDVENSCEYQQIKKVFIFNGVSVINEYAFANFKSLIDVHFTSSIHTIRYSAFKNCNKITRIYLPEGLLIVESEAFSEMKSLTSITIPSTLISFACTFDNCPSLSSIYVSPNSTHFESINNTYLVTKDLTELLASAVCKQCIYIPKSVTKILKYTFINQKALEEVKFLSDNFNSIGPGAFQGCTNLRKCELKNSIQSIYDNAFSGTKISCIIIPKSLSYLGYNAFHDCNFIKTIIVTNANNYFVVNNGVLSNKEGSIIFAISQGTKSIKINRTVEFIAKGILSSCKSLQNVTVESTSRFYKANNDFLFISLKKEISAIPGSRLSKIEIPNDIEAVGQFAAYNSRISGLSYENNTKLRSIREYAFKNSSIEHFHLPSTLTTIKKGSFENCTCLKNITIPSSVIFIGNGAFKNDINLKFVEYCSPASVPIECFQNCTRLERITFNNSITFIHNCAFENCHSLISLDVSCSHIEHNSFLGCSSMRLLKLKQTISIEAFAFSNCYCLNSIFLPSSLITIGTCAFFNCSSLQEINLPSNSKLESLGHGSFSHCKVSKLILPQSLKIIGNGAFSGCPLNNLMTFPHGNFQISSSTIYNKDKTELISVGSSVVNLGLPPTLNKIHYGAFLECKNLSVLWFDLKCSIDTLESYSLQGAESLFYLTLPQSIKYLSHKCFVRLHNLKQVTFLGNSAIEKIPQECFCDLKNITKVVFDGESILKSIGPRAFSGCSSLFYFQMPPTVLYLHSCSFENCCLLSYLNLPATLEVLASDAFCGCTALASVTYSGARDFKNSKGAFDNTIVSVIVVGTNFKGDAFAGIPAIRQEKI